jgi:hypothetical protein
MRLEPGQRIDASLKAVAYTGVEGVERIDPDGTVIKRS